MVVGSLGYSIWGCVYIEESVHFTGSRVRCHDPQPDVCGKNTPRHQSDVYGERAPDSKTGSSEPLQDDGRLLESRWTAEKWALSRERRSGLPNQLINGFLWSLCDSLGGVLQKHHHPATHLMVKKGKSTSVHYVTCAHASGVGDVLLAAPIKIDKN